MYAFICVEKEGWGREEGERGGDSERQEEMMR